MAAPGGWPSARPPPGIPCTRRPGRAAAAPEPPRRTPTRPHRVNRRPPGQSATTPATPPAMTPPWATGGLESPRRRSGREQRRVPMAGRIRDEDIAVVRERSAIDEVVGEYLQLRNAGGGALKALCPFHDEKTPSFHVTPARGLWYCFSCSEGGDVIKFVQKIDNLGFTEAIERLANRAGIDLRYEQGGHIPGQAQSHR